LDLSAEPGTSLKLSSPAATTKSQVGEQAEKQKCRLQSSKVKERFISFLAEKNTPSFQKRQKNPKTRQQTKQT